MAALDFAKGADLWVNAHQKVWKHDRSKSVGASEAFGCQRKAWFNKHGTEKDPDYVQSWGATKRGDIIEEHFAEPAAAWYLRETHPTARLIWGGKKQRTLHAPDAPLSATPDGLVINADDDALSTYGIESLGGSGCFSYEIKSIDPRVNLREEKAIHRGQTIVQMGIIRETTKYKPNYALIFYADASFLDDISIFIVQFDQRTYDAAKQRARAAFDVDDVSSILPEGKIDGTCDYCPYQRACSRASEAATPNDGEANEANTESPIMVAFEQLLIDERRLSYEKKKTEKAHKEASEKVKDMLREVGVKRVNCGDIKASITWVKGRKSLDRKAMEEDGIDLSQYEKEGDGYDILRITEKGPEKDES
jgi:CRISPR/Cas system-associated exonuclease Cas4 (RecB family)